METDRLNTERANSRNVEYGCSSMRTTFWEITPCNLVEADRRFRGSYCFHHQGDSSTLLWSHYTPLKRRFISTRLQVLYPRRLASSYSPLGEPEISQILLKVNSVLTASLMLEATTSCRRHNHDLISSQLSTQKFLARGQVMVMAVTLRHLSLFIDNDAMSFAAISVKCKTFYCLTSTST
jgi:hypothetical protein